MAASDYNTMIYTVATSGTDQVVRLWRIYGLRDTKGEKSSSRLIPDGTTVYLFWSWKTIEMKLI